MATPTWTPLLRDYDREKAKTRHALTAATSHPLLLNKPKQAVVVERAVKSLAAGTSSNKGVGKKSVLESDDPMLIDPLSAFANSRQPIIDPLSSSSAIETPQKANVVETKSEIIDNSRQVAQDAAGLMRASWEQKKQQIRKDYTIAGNITVNSSAITEFIGSGVEDGSSTKQVNKYDKRLASLERKAVSAEQKIEISQKEYETHVETLSSDLSKAWAKDERVASLKIVIQIAKLLADTNVPAFYPSTFIIATDVLDRFGEMVFTRLLNRSEDALNAASSNPKQRLRLSENFSSSEVPVLAKETCRNWFYKIACIRELLPRVYVEIALLKCYRFLTDTDFPVILTRIGSIIRGLGDPLLSFYARLYLVVVGNEVCPQHSNHIITMLQDDIFTLSMWKDSLLAAELEKKKLNSKSYFYLLSPAIEWTLKCVGKKATKETFQTVLQMFRDHCNDSMVLKHIIDSFEGSFYAHAAMGMATLIKSANVSCFTTVDLFASLGRQLAIYPPPEEQRLSLLNDVWKVVSKSTELLPYVRCTAAWLDVVQRHYSEREMVVLLGSLSGRIGQPSNSSIDFGEALQTQLEGLLSSLIGQSSTFGTAVLTSEHLLKILDVFKGMKKVQLCKDILESFRSQKASNDPVLINTLFDLARVIHDSVDGLSAYDDVTYNSRLLCNFIDQIDFGRDLEQQLNFYVECRAAFPNFDMVKDKLIVCVNNLSMKAFRFVKGKHNKKTTTFVKACLAYCHITIPSLTDIFRRLELLFQCSQVALVNQCLPQTDTFLKAAISLIPELPTHYEFDGKRMSNEDRVAEYLNSLLSFLVLCPGHPELGPFYIVQGLLNAIPKFAWLPSTTAQSRVYINILSLLCAFAQRSLPYHITGVQSNDELYGGADGYVTELTELTSVVVAAILKQMTEFGERSESASKLCQSRCSLDLVNILVNNMELKEDLLQFSWKLLELANRNKSIFSRSETRYFQLTIDAFVRKLQNQIHPLADILVPKLKALVE